VSARKKRPRPKPAPDANAARAGGRRHRLSRGALGLGVAALAIVIALVAWLVTRAPNGNSGDGGQLAALPAPRDSSAPRTPAPADFAGATTCASCHAAQYAAWRTSTHGTAGGPPGDVKVIAPFDGTPIRFRDAVVIPAAAGRRYTFLVRQDGRPDRSFSVDGVVGGGHMAGGGTQGFVSRFPDGTWRFLPFDWSRQSSHWFCNSGTRAGKGWVPITADLALADCGDWPPQRVLGDEPRFANCQGCHGSQIDVRLDTVQKRWQTHVASLAIDCESCHGPAKQHVTLMSNTPRPTNGDIGLVSLATLDKDRSLSVCLTCHALKSQLATGFLPGASLLAAYSLRLPQLGDAALLPDGRTRTFAYQEGHLSSACYLKGGMTCATCHDPHSQRYRDAFGAPLPGRFDDRQCTSCHASKAENPTSHTKHAAASEGSRCTSCHMPYRQQLEIGHAVRYARSDHTIAIPRPTFDASQGITSACKSCHADRDETALDAQVRAWYGTLAPHDPAVAAVSRGEEAKTRVEAARLLIAADSRHTSAVFAGLARFVEKWLAPDMPDLEPQIAERLRVLARHEDMDVRATALAALHFARGGDADTRRLLGDALRALGPDDAPVRARWATVLGFLADGLLAGGNPGAAVTTYRKAVEITPLAPRLHLNLGLAQAQAGDLQGAMASYTRSLTLDPRQPLVLVNMGIAFESSGDASQAESAYRRAAALDPNEPLAHFNLGNVYLKRGDAPAAIPEYERAASLDPSLAKAHFYLADAYARTGALRRALDEVHRGLEFDAGNAEARSVAARLEQAIARTGGGQ
jgi:tetratricopeptide (TPR) repeat protein